uniref:Uncharacterized protein n=1 Tax=Anguilla anguilla TaxID=7936 RepID=A0A0E9RLS3_ANGAN
MNGVYRHGFRFPLSTNAADFTCQFVIDSIKN